MSGAAIRPPAKSELSNTLRTKRLLGPPSMSSTPTGRWKESATATSPGEQFLGIPGVDDPVAVHTRARRAFAAVQLPVELARGRGVRVDGEHAPRLRGEEQQPLGRIQPLRPRVDLHGDVVGRARVEDQAR